MTDGGWWRRRAGSDCERDSMSNSRRPANPPSRWTSAPSRFTPMGIHPGYYAQRYDLWSKYDEGIRMDRRGWQSVTPEAIAIAQAERCRSHVLLDPMCGVGGNVIQFARTCSQVIAVDIDPPRLAMARHNAQLYGLSKNRIDFVIGDATKMFRGFRKVPDTVFLSIDWGGPKYKKRDVFDIKDFSPNGEKIFKMFRQITPNICFYLPRNVDRFQVRDLPALVESDSDDSKSSDELVEFHKHMRFRSSLMSLSVDDISQIKAVSAYYGNLAQNAYSQSMLPKHQVPRLETPPRRDIAPRFPRTYRPQARAPDERTWIRGCARASTGENSDARANYVKSDSTWNYAVQIPTTSSFLDPHRYSNGSRACNPVGGDPNSVITNSGTKPFGYGGNRTTGSMASARMQSSTKSFMNTLSYSGTRGPSSVSGALSNTRSPMNPLDGGNRAPSSVTRDSNNVMTSTSAPRYSWSNPYALAGNNPFRGNQGGDFTVHEIIQRRHSAPNDYQPDDRFYGGVYAYASL